MAHKMGLVRISLGTKQVNTTYTDYVNNDGTDGITNSAKITITASNVFSEKLPFLYDGKYCYIGKLNTKPTFKTSTKGIRRWADFAPTDNLVSNSCIDLTAEVAWSNNYYYKANAYSTVAAEQTFSATANTIYKIECWGSSGTSATRAESVNYTTIGGVTYTIPDPKTFEGGKGGYSKGYISLPSDKTLFLYTGDHTIIANGQSFNGGGQGYSVGGGGTDVRLTGGAWNLFNGLKSRIIVAGGGGGACVRGQWYGDGAGGYGGGLVGGDGQVANFRPEYQPGQWGYVLQKGGTQVEGGHAICQSDNWGSAGDYNYYNGLELPGNFGRFGRGLTVSGHTHEKGNSQGSAGGGWYGGGTGWHAGGGGGSGFISGYSGCVAINQTSSTDEDHMVHKTGTNCERYDDTYYFTDFSGCYHNDNMVLKGGNETFTSPAGSLTGSGTETGHNATGYIIITECPLED